MDQHSVKLVPRFSEHHGDVNLSGITYAGTNADLVALRNAGCALECASISHLLRPSHYRSLRNGPGSHNTSFSGTIATVPDGGTTVMLLGAALGVLGIARRALKR